MVSWRLQTNRSIANIGLQWNNLNKVNTFFPTKNQPPFPPYFSGNGGFITLCWYWSFYTHRLRESVSPYAWFKKYILCILMHKFHAHSWLSANTLKQIYHACCHRNLGIFLGLWLKKKKFLIKIKLYQGHIMFFLKNIIGNPFFLMLFLRQNKIV